MTQRRDFAQAPVPDDDSAAESSAAFLVTRGGDENAHPRENAHFDEIRISTAAAADPRPDSDGSLLTDEDGYQGSASNSITPDVDTDQGLQRAASFDFGHSTHTTDGGDATMKRRRRTAVNVSSKTSMQVPLEVVERIMFMLVDWLDDSDTSHYPTVRSCALVSKAWSVTARRVLMQRVVLYPRSADLFIKSIAASSASSPSRTTKQTTAQKGTAKAATRHCSVDTLFLRDVFNSRLERLLGVLSEGPKKLIVSIEQDRVEDEGIDMPPCMSAVEELVILRASPFAIRPPPASSSFSLNLRYFRYTVGQISALWIYRTLELSRSTIRSFDVELPDELSETECIDGWLPFLPLFESLTIRNPRDWLGPHLRTAKRLRWLAFDLDFDDASDLQPLLSAIPTEGQIESLEILGSRAPDEQDLLIESSRWILNEPCLSGLKRVAFPSDDEGSSFNRSPSYKNEMANDFLALLAERGVEVVWLEPSKQYYQ